jgi:hypothetical protein
MAFKSEMNFETNPWEIFFWQDRSYYFKDGGNFKAENQPPIYIGARAFWTYPSPGLSPGRDFTRPGEPLELGAGQRCSV